MSYFSRPFKRFYLLDSKHGNQSLFHKNTTKVHACSVQNTGVLLNDLNL